MSEPLVLINLFSMPAEMVDRFVADWEANIAPAAGAPGFRGTRLHRAIDPDAQFPVVNIARWDSVEEWQATAAKYFSASGPGTGPSPQRFQGGPSATANQAALYTVVHTTPDPLENTDAQSERK